MKALLKIVALKALFIGIFSVCMAQERLVVLDPASIEIIYELGSGDDIVAIAHLQHTQIAPIEKTSKLASVGSFSNPSVEKIISFKPTLVVLSLYSLGLKERLEQLNIKTLYLEANSLADLPKNITTLATMLDKKEAGEALKARIKAEFDALAKEPLNKSAIFLFSSNPLMAFADNSVIADIFRAIGVKNLTSESKIARPIISSEFILKANPDILMLGVEANDPQLLLSQNPAFKQLKAAKTNHIFTYPNAHSLLRVSPTIIERIKAFRAVLLSQNGTK